ncbi:hypothetical protein [Bradyrhizobium erythrophlei]|uniref:Uncharacterized protein n=1 Tax=Bradyrhizobium erythrophlei TaxID=1437360 RepID=A0A1M5NSG5_9BRAD|nr:hypothetical protein [Bradyrhizobium erythrophlei]SHG92491.1 hypothetical protein SAMN05443248_3100 [Bradyrhizobium erythrophlei]
MTQAAVKTSIDSALGSQLDRLFGVLVTNLETQSAAEATAEFRKGLEFSLRAHAIATSVAEELIKG